MALIVGTAAWSIPKAVRASFETEGSLLERYARVFHGTEINSSFYKSHKPETYARWAAAVPSDFRFAAKIPKTITHGQRLADEDNRIEAFLTEIKPLGDKLGPLLVQLPPSLIFEEKTVTRFLSRLRDLFDGDVVCEPRHRSWFDDGIDALLKHYRIARAAVDPPTGPGSAEPGGFSEPAYFRLHGTPDIYFSNYDAAMLDTVAARLLACRAARIWCIFDNTGLGWATQNALAVQRQLEEAGRLPRRASPAMTRA